MVGGPRSSPPAPFFAECAPAESRFMAGTACVPRTAERAKMIFRVNRRGYHHPEARQLGSGVGRQELLRVGMRRVGLQRHGSLLNGRISTPALLITPPQLG